MVSQNIIVVFYLFSQVVFVLGQQDYRSLFTSTLTCKMGRLQSPIDLSDTTSKYNSTINPLYYNYQPLSNAVVNWNSEGRVLELKPESSTGNYGYLGLSRGGALKQYALVGVQISFPGEHSIEGVISQAEVKLIHDKVIPFATTVDQYRSIPDSNTHLVISILYSPSANNTDNGFMDQILSTYNTQANTFNYGTSQNINLLSYRLFQDRQFYFYEGSFTSAPCDENVNYIVVKDNFYLSPTAKNILTQAYSKYTGSIASKSRTDLFGRSVYRNYINQGESLSSNYLNWNVLASLLLLSILI